MTPGANRQDNNLLQPLSHSALQLPPLKAMDDPSEYNINTALAQLDAQGDDGKGEAR